jgi:endonuclease/exonuclease/phosphatase family metal-dependent hydrolase
MKLLCLNVSVFDANNQALAHFIQEQNPDILCLQEVTRRIDDAVDEQYISLPAIDAVTRHLSQCMYGPSSIREKMELKKFHGQDTFLFDFDGKLDFGNYTKSPYPLTFAQNIFVQKHYGYTSDFAMSPEDYPGSFLVCDFSLKEKPLRVINYHGIWTQHKHGNENTLAANKKILEVAKEAPGEVIICGDFNLFPDTPSMRVFEKDFTSLVDLHKIQTTRPKTNELSHLPRNVVDFVWVSAGIKTTHFQVLVSDVSDHYPLIVEFNLV